MATTSRSMEMESASASGVCTVPRRTSRSAVASYSNSVITLRARTLNSSGGVDRSRNPRRLSATRGWLLTLSGTVVLDEPPNGVHRHLQHAVHVGGVEVVD